MIHSATALTRSGLKDWLIQRVSAVILAAYVLFLTGYIIVHDPVTYSQWSALFSCSWMKYFTFLTVLSLIAHAWVGMWTVLTDYITCLYMRTTLHGIFVLAFLAYLLWSIRILWS